MAKVYMMCGRLCSGKSTHARRIRDEKHAVILSVDEITLALFGQDAGDKLDEYVARTEEYLFRKSVEIAEMGIDVVLDWGFWTKKERDHARAFYRAHGIECELHYIHITDEEWEARLRKRNRDVIERKTDAYYVDQGLAEKFRAIFEKPAPGEIDVLIDG